MASVGSVLLVLNLASLEYLLLNVAMFGYSGVPALLNVISNVLESLFPCGILPQGQD